jgi:hypothetical protein
MFVKYVCPLSAANESCGQANVTDFWPSDKKDVELLVRNRFYVQGQRDFDP